MIKNIVFDFGNVLFKWNEEEIIKKFSDNPEEQQVLENVIFRSKEWIQLDEGLLDYDSAIKIFENSIPTNLNINVKNIMNTWYYKMPINSEICELIKKLKNNGYKIYGLSNTHICVYEYIKKLEIGKYFDGFIISAIEKKMKPNDSIYRRLFEKYDLKPSECFFIDDSEKNIIASRNLGMEGHIFDINKFDKLEEEFCKNNINLS